jgi:hypothetical protein
MSSSVKRSRPELWRADREQVSLERAVNMGGVRALGQAARTGNG